MRINYKSPSDNTLTFLLLYVPFCYCSCFINWLVTGKRSKSATNIKLHFVRKTTHNSQKVVLRFDRIISNWPLRKWVRWPWVTKPRACFQSCVDGEGLDWSQLAQNDPWTMLSWFWIKVCLLSVSLQALGDCWNGWAWEISCPNPFLTPPPNVFIGPYAFQNAFIYSIWSVQSAFRDYISKASNG